MRFFISLSAFFPRNLVWIFAFKSSHNFSSKRTRVCVCVCVPPKKYHNFCMTKILIAQLLCSRFRVFFHTKVFSFFSLSCCCCCCCCSAFIFIRTIIHKSNQCKFIWMQFSCITHSQKVQNWLKTQKISKLVNENANDDDDDIYAKIICKLWFINETFCIRLSLSQKTYACLRACGMMQGKHTRTHSHRFYRESWKIFQ